MKPQNFLFHLFGKINSIHRILLFILFIISNSLIYSQQPASCVTDGGQADETGLKTWCWNDITIPTYSGTKGVAFSDDQLFIDSECNENSISIVDDQLHFFVDPINPPVDTSWCTRDYNMRSEIRTNPWNVQHPIGTEEWFGFSYTFGNEYIIDKFNEWLFFQVHNSIVGTSPHMELLVIKDGQYSGHDAGEIYVVNKGNYPDNHPTGITPIAGETLDIVVHAVWGDESNGLLQVWINGQSVYDKQVRTVYADYPWGGNAKWGIYKWPWANEAGVTASANQGITSLSTSIGGLRVITRHSDDPDYMNNDYATVFPTQSSTVAVTGVSVSPASETINVPDTITLVATVEPVDATNQSGVWSSSNETIATVNVAGVVTAISEGEVIITFNTNDGGFSDSTTITVTEIPIGVESVSLSPETLDLNINATDTIVAAVLPANASDQTGIWTSSDPGVATVDLQGLVQPIAVGVTTITFTTNDGGFSDTSVVTINDDHFGDYEFFNADTDELIQVVEGGEQFDLDNIGDNVNFRIIPFGGDGNPDVESVGIQWNGIENGNYGENAPIYAGMTGHIGNDYQPYTVTEGTYNFTVTYYSGDNQSGNVVAADSFALSFTRVQVNQVIASDDSTICLGDTAALVASGADSFLWSTGETSESIAVTPDATTTYTVTGDHGNGNITTDTVTVTVTESPEVDAGLDQSICQGETITLTASTTVGELLWSTGESTNTITVSPTENITYSVTADNNGCVTTDQVMVTVHSTPNADAGEDVTIINGESIVLTATGGSQYIWSTGETTSSIEVNPTTDTTYSVLVSNVSGCSSEDTVTVGVMDAIVADAGENVSICSGESTTLTASGGDIYLWSNGETTSSITVNPSETTSYSVTVSNQSQSDTDTVTVTVYESPEVDAGLDQSICQGEIITLTASTTVGELLWSTGESTNTITVSPTENITYSVTADNNGCVTTDQVMVTVHSTPNADAGEDVTIINGESIALTATGGSQYIWSTGETTSSIEVNPTTDTTYSVLVSNVSGCSSEDTVTVGVVDAIVADAGENVSICSGESTTLTASGGDIYLWSNGETTSSITVNPSETTSYSVTVSNQSQSDTDSVTVTVYELPLAEVSNDVTILSGQSATLFASGGEIYEWSTGESGDSITVTPSMDTTYTVTVYNANGCSDEASVTIYVIEQVVANAGEDTVICEGESTTLTASGGETYLWNTGETTQNITVNPFNTSQYTVTVSDTYSSDSDSVTVTVNPLPIANAGEDVTINQGEQSTLYGLGGNSYLWSTGETNANISVSPIETTTYTVTATVNGCSDTDEVTVTVISPIEAYAGEDITICNGETTELTATGGDQFEWSTGETTQSIDVDPSETAVYTVLVSNSSGSAIDDVQVNVNDCSLGGPPEEANGFDFRVFPNPTDGVLNIKISDLDLDGIIYVTDIIGKRISTLTIESGVGQVMRRELNLSTMPPGFYILNFSTKNRSITKKIILR